MNKIIEANLIILALIIGSYINGIETTITIQLPILIIILMLINNE